MDSFRVVNLTRDSPLAQKVRRAQGFWERARGLLGHSPLKEGEGLLIEPCNWIHTWGMGFPIDVLYLSRQGEVMETCPSLRPNRLGPRVPSAHSVLELPPGTIARSRTEIGDRLEIRHGVAP